MTTIEEQIKECKRHIWRLTAYEDRLRFRLADAQAKVEALYRLQRDAKQERKEAYSKLSNLERERS